MPRMCCEPKCRGNYDADSKTSVFLFPVDQERKKLWIRKIPRKNLVVAKHTAVCENHFEERFIKRIDSVKRPDGTFLTMKRGRPALTEDAVPTIFPYCAGYLTETSGFKRKGGEERRAEISQREEAAFQKRLAQDTISDFGQFQKKFKAKLENSNWIRQFFPSAKSEQRSYSAFYCIIDNFNGFPPRLICTIKIFDNLHVDIYTKLGKLPHSAIKWIFTASSTRLEFWTQFETLLSHFSSENDRIGNDFEEHMDIYIKVMQNLIEDEESHSTISKNQKFQFLLEQFKLVKASVKRYSCETLLWSFQLFATAPRSYSILRNTLLTLPHPSYLRKLASVFQMRNGYGQSTCRQEPNDNSRYYKKTFKKTTFEKRFAMVSSMLKMMYAIP